MKTIVLTLGSAAVICGFATVGWAQDCDDLPTRDQLRAFLIAAPGVTAAPLGGDAGGLFGGTDMWAAVVNRDGEVCAFVTSTPDPTDSWPGSQQIAKAKAYTANAFSKDGLALSTALLYTFVQPGHSLFSLTVSNPFEAEFLAPPDEDEADDDIAGGIITFGGGVPLYISGNIVGGLGVSGDTSCTDHEIAKRVRDLAGLNPPGGPTIDDISYSSADGASFFTHPLCPNTFRNGVDLGDELAATGY